VSGRQRPTRKRRAELSQHFLLSDTAARLVRATSISQFDLVVEIGAGRAEVVESDFLNLELPREKYFLIGNIPYSLSTEIVRKVTTATNPPIDIWLVVQREFAERLGGHPFAKESQWSLRLKPFWHLEIIDWLPPKEFTPPPSVDSAFLQLRWRGRPILRHDETAAYDRLLHTGFRQPEIGKSLNSLSTKVQLRRLALHYRFSLDDAPGSLLFAQWLGILRFLQRIGELR
jgi:23S rRNA (adenine-N6)-dimethyltransferase